MALFILGIVSQIAQGQNQGENTETVQSVIIIGTTPLPGLGVPLNEMPAAVQSANAQNIEQSRALDLSEFMNRRLGSVHVNDMQGNPFQADVNYRGYTASPLLGTPQGLSVFMDGVRLNQPFGDVVSWDLIPRAAINSVNLIPGSNPLFGLNALGGALSIETKNGRTNPGTSVGVSIGANSRRLLEMEHGGNNAQGLNWFVTGNLFKDDGWRVDSPSSVRQLFGKLGWHGTHTDLSLSVSHADNALQGNGLQAQDLLGRDWRSVYTKPDTTDNRSTLFNVTAVHDIRPDLIFSGNLFYRDIRTTTLNGDINDDALGQSIYQPSDDDIEALEDAGYQGYPVSGANAENTPFPSWSCIAQALQRDEPAEKCNGMINRSNTSQNNYGLSLQLAWRGMLSGHRNHFIAGAGYDSSRVDFRQSSELGYLNPDRSVTGVGAFGDGVTGGEEDGAPFDTRVDLHGRTTNWSLFATNTLSLGNNLNLTASGRYNRNAINNRDRIHPGGAPDSLDGDHRFSRFNPAVGLTYSPVTGFNAYAGYNEGSRAPSSIELGCANPDQPCKLPNSMAGDPPLNQVVAKTWEAGMRGKWRKKLQWNAGIFHAENHDDILFVADDQAGFGYFKNFGKTRRQGMELGMNGKVGKWSMGTNYTWLDATYQSTEIVNGSSNSSNNEALAGNPGMESSIQISPGNRIPMIPRQILKANAGYQMTPQFSVGIDMLAMAGSYARGNENNAHRPDGVHYQGDGKTAGYTLFNLGGNYAATSMLDIFIQINNLFDKRYVNAAQLGPTGFNNAGGFVARPYPSMNGEYPLQHTGFAAPGSPRLFWMGLKYRIGTAVR